MTIESKILGFPGQDNMAYVRIDTGQEIHHLEFDCGEGALHHLGRSILQEIDHLFLSHCHMDHICGFDTLFRHLYSRPRPLHIWGPPGISRIMHCRFMGFTWNLVGGSPGEMIVHEISEKEIMTHRFLCREGFRNQYFLDKKAYDKRILETKDYWVEAVVLDHNVECLGFSVTESEKTNINVERMKKEGLSQGKWCAEVKREDLPGTTLLDTGSKKYRLDELREMLVEKKKGQKCVYITDIIMNESNAKKIFSIARDADEMIIECTYLDTEAELARENYHLTVTQAANLAKNLGTKKLILFHISDRYGREDIGQMLKDALKIFPGSTLPRHWNV